MLTSPPNRSRASPMPQDTLSERSRAESPSSSSLCSFPALSTARSPFSHPPRHIDEKAAASNFTFKCHRKDSPTSKQSTVFAVNDISFHPYGTFSTSGADGTINFWDKESKTRLKSEISSFRALSSALTVFLLLRHQLSRPRVGLSSRLASTILVGSLLVSPRAPCSPSRAFADPFLPFTDAVTQGALSTTAKISLPFADPPFPCHLS